MSRTVVLVVGLPALASDLTSEDGLSVRLGRPDRPLGDTVADHPGIDALVASSGSRPPDETAGVAADLAASGVRVVLVNDGPVPFCPPGVATVTEPFTGADVVALLADRPASAFALAWTDPSVGSAPTGPACAYPPTRPALATATEDADVPPWLSGAGSTPSDEAIWQVEPDPEEFDPWADIPEVGADGPPSCGGGIDLWDPETGELVDRGPAPAPFGEPVPAAVAPQPVEPGTLARAAAVATEHPPPSPAPCPPILSAGSAMGDDGHRPGHPGVLVFACPKGGSGKTSLSLHYAAFLAEVLADRGRRVVWVDANLQQADGARYLGADERGSRTIMDLQGDQDPDERAVLAACSPPEVTGQRMWALFGPAIKAEADPRTVSPALYRRVVQVLRTRFDHVVVDTPVAEHHNDFFRSFVLPETDQLITVVPPLLPVVRGVREWLELQSQPVGSGGGGLEAARVRIVLNMTQAGDGCPVEAVRDAWLTRWTWAGEVPYDPHWTAATNNGDLLAGHRDLRPFLADLVRLTTGDIVEGSRRRSSGGWRARLVRLLEH